MHTPSLSTNPGTAPTHELPEDLLPNSLSSSEEESPTPDQLHASIDEVVVTNADEQDNSALSMIHLATDQTAGPDRRTMTQMALTLLGIGSAAFIIAGGGMLLISYLSADTLPDRESDHTKFARMEGAGVVLLLARQLISNYATQSDTRGSY